MKREKRVSLPRTAQGSSEPQSSVDAEAEQLWIEEAQRRYDACLKGELEALEGDDVMRRARSRVAAKYL